MNSEPAARSSFFRSTMRLGHTLGHLLDLSKDQATHEKIVENISNGADFRGANVWILAFAIVVCSIGLNTNSTAVIIGAMLISPLMGPIIGIGLGMEILDMDLIRKSIRNLAIEAGVSILASTIYFLITPLSDAQSELLARTNPTIWDVGIAFFGGLAGIVATSRVVPSNAFPGVAIATALMPPLCTAGYGLATGQFRYFIGALYLFVINGFFIALATLAGAKLLRLPKKAYVDPERRKYVARWIMGLAFLTLLPSVFLAYGVVNQSIEQRNLQRFLRNECNFPASEVIRSRSAFEGKERKIILTLVGIPLSNAQMNALNEKIAYYGFPNTRIQFIQQSSVSSDASDIPPANPAAVERLLKNNEDTLLAQRAEIQRLQTRLDTVTRFEAERQKVWRELKAQYPYLEEGVFGSGESLTGDPENLVTGKPVLFVTLVSPRLISPQDLKRIQSWLKVRLSVDSIDIRVRRT